jgi:hypothetical protein
MRRTALCAALILFLGCGEGDDDPEITWTCPEIEDAVLVVSEYLGTDPFIVGRENWSFPHVAGDPGSFRALPDTTKGIITLKYRRDGTEIVEVWSLQKLR